MRHPWSFRLLRACLALWFVLSGGEPGLVHACPMHGQVAGGAHAHAMATPGAHAASPRAMAHPASHAAGHDASLPHAPHACTCVSTCAAAAAVVALGEAPALDLQARVASHAAVPLPEVRVALGGRTAHRQPFANGPPAGTPTA